ncbi:MAG: DinB family protein [Ferruginibacter sp.]|nr:DinB family protein [Chitinophagaceae bacterium]
MPSSISTRLQYQHQSLMDIIEGLSDEQIRRPIVPGKWSVFENIVHLQTYQHTFVNRIRQILGENNPSFPRYTAEADPLFLDNCGRSTREIIGDLLTIRKELAAGMLSFSESDFTKTGTHPVFGQMVLLEWLNFFLLHEAHHLLTIFKLGAELKRASS